MAATPLLPGQNLSSDILTHLRLLQPSDDYYGSWVRIGPSADLNMKLESMISGTWNATNLEIHEFLYSIGYERISAKERFELVSSLYGPGNLACWIFLLLSVSVSWTLNPRYARKDTITNDLVAALFLPVVAVAHFFHQVHQRSKQGTYEDGTMRIGLRNMLSSIHRDDVRAAAAMEAPLTICEDFIAWAQILCFLAARNGHSWRITLVLAVCALCLSVEAFLWTLWVPFPSSFLVRPFFFHLIPLMGVILGWYLLMLLIHLARVLGLHTALRRAPSEEVESGTTPNARRYRFLLRTCLSWTAGFSACAVGIAAIWIKYAWLCPAQIFPSVTSVRFAPKSNVGIWELDQVVAAMGGAVALFFSLFDAFKQRRKAKVAVR